MNTEAPLNHVAPEEEPSRTEDFPETAELGGEHVDSNEAHAAEIAEQRIGRIAASFEPIKEEWHNSVEA